MIVHQIGCTPYFADFKNLFLTYTLHTFTLKTKMLPFSGGGNQCFETGLDMACCNLNSLALNELIVHRIEEDQIDCTPY